MVVIILLIYLQNIIMVKSKKDINTDSKDQSGSSTSSKSSNKSKSLSKINIPGVSVKEVLGMEPFIPDLREHLAAVALIAVIVCQLRTVTPKMSVPQFSVCESPNFYVKKVLGKSKSILTVSAAVAVRRSLGPYSLLPEEILEESIAADLQDLITKPSGPSNSKENVNAIMKSPERLRRYRRGLMLKMVGEVQATCFHYPGNIHREIMKIDPNNFLELLPFETTDLTMDRLHEILDTYLNPQGLDEDKVFCDGITIPNSENNLLPLEEGLPVARAIDDTRQLFDRVEIPRDFDSLPEWKKGMLSQAAKIKKGGV